MYITLSTLACRAPRHIGLRTLLAVAVSSACQNATSDIHGPLTNRALAEYLTGDAVAALQDNGQFKLREPISSAEITRQQAEDLASVWPEQFGQWIAGRLQREHGDSIVMTALHICGRSYYLEAPFEKLDDQLRDLTPASARLFGPWWLVTLCGSKGQPQLSLALSSYATDLRIVGGKIEMPAFGGEWFAAEGIPTTVGMNFVEPPEELVLRTGAAYGRRVTKAPELIAPLRQDGFPNHPRWRLQLDAPLTARSKGRVYRAQTEIASWRSPAGARHTYQVPLEEQPSEMSFRYPDATSLRNPEGPVTFLVGTARRRAGVPVLFESVSLEGGD